jgi:hypothetical protein
MSQLGRSLPLERAAIPVMSPVTKAEASSLPVICFFGWRCALDAQLSKFSANIGHHCAGWSGDTLAATTRLAAARRALR